MSPTLSSAPQLLPSRDKGFAEVIVSHVFDGQLSKQAYTNTPQLALNMRILKSVLLGNARMFQYFPELYEELCLLVVRKIQEKYNLQTEDIPAMNDDVRELQLFEPTKEKVMAVIDRVTEFLSMHEDFSVDKIMLCLTTDIFPGVSLYEDEQYMDTLEQYLLSLQAPIQENVRQGKTQNYWASKLV